MLLEGMFLPLMTPFTPDGRLSVRKLEDNVARYSKTPAAGLVALSKIGQPSLLSDAETREAMFAVAGAASAEKVLLCGVARDSVAGTLELIEEAAKAGYDAVLVPVPTILRGGAVPGAPLMGFFRAVADRAALPVILDSGLSEGEEIAIEMAVQLAKHPGIVGMMDSSGSRERIEQMRQATAEIRREVTVTTIFTAVTGRMLSRSRAAAGMLLSPGDLAGAGTAVSIAPPETAARLKTRTKATGFQVLCGRTAAMLDGLQAGAAGAMPGLAASAPQACYEVLAAWKDGDPALAAEKQERLRRVAKRVEEELGVAGIKYGCDLNGYFGGRPRLPSLPLTAAERSEIEDLMAAIRN